MIIGVKFDGTKELLAISDGLRESKVSWLELLRALKAHGLDVGPRLAVGDGALGFWAALDELYPQTRHQRCWVHKTANVLNAVPKSLQAKVKAQLHEIWMAPTRAEAINAFNHFVQTWRAKYPKAADKLVADREALLAFYDFPAEHWIHLRTTNPIESTFATVVTAPPERRTASRARPSWASPSSSSRRPRNPGDGFAATNALPNSWAASSSRTANP